MKELLIFYILKIYNLVFYLPYNLYLLVKYCTFKLYEILVVYPVNWLLAKWLELFTDLENLFNFFFEKFKLTLKYIFVEFLSLLELPALLGFFLLDLAELYENIDGEKYVMDYLLRMEADAEASAPLELSFFKSYIDKYVDFFIYMKYILLKNLRTSLAYPEYGGLVFEIKKIPGVGLVYTAPLESPYLFFNNFILFILVPDFF